MIVQRTSDGKFSYCDFTHERLVMLELLRQGHEVYEYGYSKRLRKED